MEAIEPAEVIASPKQHTLCLEVAKFKGQFFFVVSVHCYLYFTRPQPQTKLKKIEEISSVHSLHLKYGTVNFAICASCAHPFCTVELLVSRGCTCSFPIWDPLTRHHSDSEFFPLQSCDIFQKVVGLVTIETCVLEWPALRH